MIKINQLNKRFGKLQVLKDIDLEMQDGNVYAIVGPNASGKTTLIKSILGLVKPDSGTIDIQGERVNGNYGYRKYLGYMPQTAHFPENLTAKEILHLVRDLRGNPEQTDQELMQKFKIDKELNKPLKNLSGGTRQKISAIIAFLFNPQTLILDEPTAGLDPISSSILKDKIITDSKAGKTFILTSHIMNEVEELANHIIFLLDGKIHFKGSVDMFQKHTQEKKLERAIATMMENM
jgi:Cu-processing system ATP-binding protein